jgi:hypothetical protein
MMSSSQFSDAFKQDAVAQITEWGTVMCGRLRLHKV